MELDTDTSPYELAVLSSGAGHHRSEQRRRELQRLANVLTDRDLDVMVSFGDEGAFARAAPDEAPHDFEINIPTETFAQVETDLPDRVWNRRVQLGLLFHELGHVLYSDFSLFEHYYERVRPLYREVFQTAFNAAEDVVVEAQMAEEFAVGRDFRTLNDTFRRLQLEDQRAYVDLFEETADTLSYTVHEALLIGILSKGFGSDHRFTAMLDPDDDGHRIHNGRREVLTSLRPHVDRFVTDMLRSPDGSARVERAVRFFERLQGVFADLPTVQTVRLQTESFRPVEAGEFAIRPPDKATELVKPENGSEDAQSIARDDTATAPAEVPAAESGDRNAGNADGVSATPDERTPDTTTPLEREARELLRIVRSDTTRPERAAVAEPDDMDGDMARWQAAGQAAEQLTADLRSVLRRRRRTRMHSGHRSGQVDPRRLVRAAQGRDRVFQRRHPGDDRDYSCLIVLDRSGSMDGRRIEAAEDATVQLVRALDAVGVDVSVLSIFGAPLQFGVSRPQLELPFGGEPRRFADTLTSGRVGGGTPLSDAIAIARERIDAGSGSYPLVVVLTDGAPDSEDAYAAELERCPVDVYGVYLGAETGTHGAYFDRVVYTDPDSVDTALRNLARRLFE